MSLMSWLFPSRTRSRSEPASSGVGRKGGAKGGTGSSADSNKRKSERAARRELLYGVVREAMVRAGVLTASYKFKVLSLDSGGLQYLVMVDLARGVGGDADRLGEIEALIIQSAKSRHDIQVTAVYWRTSEHATVGNPTVRKPPPGTDSEPMPLESQPAPFHSAPAPLVDSSRGPAYEPIQADEVEAFKKALVAGSTGPVPLAPLRGAPDRRAAARQGSHSYTLLTGYEDTEMHDPDNKSPLLSGTQYGDLR